MQFFHSHSLVDIGDVIVSHVLTLSIATNRKCRFMINRNTTKRSSYSYLFNVAKITWVQKKCIKFYRNLSFFRKSVTCVPSSDHVFEFYSIISNCWSFDFRFLFASNFTASFTVVKKNNDWHFACILELFRRVRLMAADLVLIAYVFVYTRFTTFNENKPHSHANRIIT